MNLPTRKEEWETANMYFHANLDLHSEITDIENEVCVFQSCFYNYFKIDKSKDLDRSRNYLFSEYNHLSRRQLKKKFLKQLKSNTDADNSTRIRYVSKLIRIKYSKKDSRLRTK